MIKQEMPYTKSLQPLAELLLNRFRNSKKQLNSGNNPDESEIQILDTELNS